MLWFAFAGSTAERLLEGCTSDVTLECLAEARPLFMSRCLQKSSLSQSRTSSGRLTNVLRVGRSVSVMPCVFEGGPSGRGLRSKELLLFQRSVRLQMHIISVLEWTVLALYALNEMLEGLTCTVQCELQSNQGQNCLCQGLTREFHGLHVGGPAENAQRARP